MSLRSSNAIRSPAVNLRSGSAHLLAFGLFLSDGTARSAPLLPTAPASNTDAEIEQVRAVVHRGGSAVGPRMAVVRRGTTVVGPRGNVAVHRTTVVRPGWQSAGARWARPSRYRWPIGGAIAAGAAIGFVTAATAAAWASAAPAPGMCWYYTDSPEPKAFGTTARIAMQQMGERGRVARDRSRSAS
jgi:hypothetical protein